METEEQPREVEETKAVRHGKDHSDSVFVKWFGPAAGGILLFIWEILAIVLVAAVIILPIRYFLVQPFYVRGASMEPTFYDREYLLIDEISYRFSEPERGDVVVFRYPHDPKEFFIKRVIGVPGDTIDVQNGQVIITNDEHMGGVVLEEEYVTQVVTKGNEHVTLNPDEYYLLGDNRSASLDSRSFGPVKEEYLIGKVWLRGLPISEFWIFEPPIYEQLETDQL